MAKPQYWQKLSLKHPEEDIPLFIRWGDQFFTGERIRNIMNETDVIHCVDGKGEHPFEIDLNVPFVNEHVEWIYFELFPAVIFDNYGQDVQIRKMIEELDELKEAAVHFLAMSPKSSNALETTTRDFQNLLDAKKHLAEEMADVFIMTSQIAYGLCLELEVQKMMKFKLIRQFGRMAAANAKRGAHE